MRILAVSPYYDPEGGGLERYNHNLLVRLAAMGHDVEAVAFTRGTPGEVERDRVRVTLLKPSIVLGNTPIAPGLRRLVGRRIAATEPDVVLGHTPVPYAAEMAYLAARRAGVPFVVTYHAGRLRSGSAVLAAAAAIDRATLQRRMLEGAAGLIAVSRFVRDHALARRRADVDVVPPGVDHGFFAPDGAPQGKGILFVGPLSSNYQWKGVDTMWQAFRHLRRRVPDATLTLVGAGDRLAEFRLLARAMPRKVSVPGRLSDASLRAAYRKAAVVVLPSTTDAEAFGMVLAEANACGRPVVGSAIGGIPDFVRDGDNGLLALPGDAADLADRIAALLEHPDRARAMGRRGRARVVAHHDWDKLAARTAKVLGTVTDG